MLLKPEGCVAALTMVRVTGNPVGRHGKRMLVGWRRLRPCPDFSCRSVACPCYAGVLRRRDGSCCRSRTPSTSRCAVYHSRRLLLGSGRQVQACQSCRQVVSWAAWTLLSIKGCLRGDSNERRRVEVVSVAAAAMPENQTSCTQFGTQPPNARRHTDTSLPTCRRCARMRRRLISGGASLTHSRKLQTHGDWLQKGRHTSCAPQCVPYKAVRASC